MSEKLKWAAVIVVSMVLGGSIVAGIGALTDDGPPGPGTTVIERVSPGAGSGVSTSLESLADLVDQVRPSIVQIQTGTDVGFGSVGSGIVLDKDGHILTNNHVVPGASADVILSDGTSGTATVVGRDPGNDLAVIRADIPAAKLVPAKLGDSNTVRVGDKVLAVGNPFGKEGTVTEGIVSGLGRSLTGNGGRPLRQLIQADAAINPGNSGGALFNTRGEVIGITTAIENPTGSRTFVGIGYAVPVNTALRFLPEMLSGRTVQHPRMGIQLQDLTPSIAQSMGLPENQKGVVVMRAEPNSAAARAGIVGGNNPDVIVAIEGQAVEDYGDLADIIDQKKVGDTVEVTIIRNRQEMRVQVTLEAWSTGST
jgi:S1-C subfamily serine protease